MTVTAVLLFGAVSLDRLALNLLPEISYPSLTVQTDYEDAAPEEIEALVTRPVEEAVGTVSGLNRISSASRAGQSEVVLEFRWNTDMDFAGIDVREKLDLVKFPREVQRPVILRFDPANDPILRIQLHGGFTLAQLRDIAEREIKQRVEAVPGVAAVKIAGGREEQIRIEIDERKVASLGIPITEVTSILRQENLNQASGSLYDYDRNYLVRMVNEFRTVEEVRDIVVADRDGRQVVLRDIAEVWRGSKERDIIARFNGEESVEMAVFKEGDSNTVSVSEAVADLLERLKREATYAAGLESAIVFDQAQFIRQSIQNVLLSALVGGLLATFVLFVFLKDGRSTVIVAVSIPISVMATFAAMYQSGITLNIMSLGGVALGVGMLVDNSIVVLEAVQRYRKPGVPLAEAVYTGTSEVAMPVVASTLTTVAVFLPTVFVEGVAGQLFRDQALTITFSLLASLAVAITVIPMLLAVRLQPPEEGLGHVGAAMTAAPRHAALRFARSVIRFVSVEAPRVLVMDTKQALGVFRTGFRRITRPALAAFDTSFAALSGHYTALLKRSLDHKGTVMFVVAASVVVAGGLALNLGADLIPPLSQGEFSFILTLPQGSPIEATDAAMKRIEERAREISGTAMVFSNVGGSQDQQFSTADLEEHVGTLHVVMANPDDTAAEALAIERIREVIADTPGAEQQFERPALFSFKTPVEVEVFAFSLEDQRLAVDLIAARMARIEGVKDIETTTRPGGPEVQIRFDRHRLASLGLQENQVATVLRNKIRGDVASRYRDGDRQIDILVRVDEMDRNAVVDIENMVINSASRRRGDSDSNGSSGRTQRQRTGDSQENEASTPAETGTVAERRFVPVRLGQVASVEMVRGPAEIRRIRSQRAAIVTANLSGRDLASVSDEIRAALVELSAELPVEATAAVGGQQEELETSYRSLGFALALAVFLVYLVMASQFESLLHPFVILLTVPLSLVGVVFALLVTGTEISVVVLLGAIVLAGIAVNNSIVLIDFTNRLRADGRSKRQALIEAGAIRLRPILMTSLTTLLGLVPMAFGWGEGDEVRSPMAVAVIGGLLASTPLTLIIIPVVYDLLDRRRAVASATVSPAILSERVDPIG